MVGSESDVAEPDWGFFAPAEPHDAFWYIVRHELKAGEKEMLKVTPEVPACRLCIRLTPSSQGTAATITGTHTSLGPKGDKFVANVTQEYYA